LQEFNDCILESLSKPIDLLVEEYFEGFELDIDVLIQNNEIKFLTISDNFPPTPPNFKENGGISPSIKLSPNHLKIVEKLTTEWLSLMNFQNSILHFEALFNPNMDENTCLMPIEINPRIGGCETWSLIKASKNIDLLLEFINICLGIETNITNKNYLNEFRCISKNFLASNKSLENMKINHKYLAEDKDVIELVIFKQVDEIIELNENFGWISIRNANGLSEAQLIKKLDKITSNLIFK